MTTTLLAAEPDTPDFLAAGGGEMRKLIRDFDWSRSSIGTPDQWPVALRTMVRILLANRFPMLLWWGPDYISIYNDAYIPILGRKHPWGLGQPVRQCWSEIWDVLQPLIDTPFKGGPATWVEDIELHINRVGFAEETHFTVAYSPVPDETAPGGIGGVLATVHEISDKVVGQRRITALRDLGTMGEARTMEDACAIGAKTLEQHAKEIPFALLYILEGNRARLAGSCGIGKNTDIAPAVIDLNQPSAWPLAEARRTGQPQLVKNLLSAFPTVPPGPWPEPPHSAIVTPIHSPVTHQVSGFFVGGISSRLKFDETYKGFFELAAAQVAMAFSGAQAYVEERRRAETLAEVDLAKTRFFSNISHEFRTPLTLILGPLEDALANTHGILPLGAARDVALAKRNAIRLQKLVNTLLDFSRIEAGRAQVSLEPTDLAAYTTDIASNFRSLCEKAGLTLNVNCAPLRRDAFVDRDMWEKIVFNLLSNAFKFTFEGVIEVTLRDAGDNLQLTVSDTGVGIPAAELPHMFERFHRIENSRSRTHEGTGIGLALVKDLVRLHDGDITVASQPDKGSTFTVTIPFRTDAPAAKNIYAPAATKSTAESYVQEASLWLAQEGAEPGSVTGDKPYIIWADDNADMRLYVCRLLNKRFDVKAVADGEAALQEARIRRPDLILSDVMMPKLDGFGLVRALRSEAPLKDIPVILLSARADEESRIQGLEIGANDYLTKPFNARELVAKVAANISKK